MRSDDFDVEQRVFDLLGEHTSTAEIAAKLGMTPREALPIVLKVIDERGTPNLASARAAIERLEKISFV